MGVEVETSAEVTAAEHRLQGKVFKTKTENQVSCCYAVQNKVWVTDPDNSPWEIYTVLDDAATFGQTQPNASTSVCATC